MKRSFRPRIHPNRQHPRAIRRSRADYIVVLLVVIAATLVLGFAFALSGSGTGAYSLLVVAVGGFANVAVVGRPDDE